MSMKEGAAVELMKIGCAGWWYIRDLGKCSSFFLVLIYEAENFRLALVDRATSVREFVGLCRVINE